MNDSLLDHIENDDCEEVIADVGKDLLQYCKRVKYLDKAWILISKNQNYYWISQDNIPINKLRKINVEELEDTQGKLEAKLKDIISQKVDLAKTAKGGESPSSQALSNRDIEITELKFQLNDLKMSNNTLQQANLHLKQRINELNDMIFGLADTDKSHDNIKKIVDLHSKNEDLSSKLLSQFEITKKLEKEVEIKNSELE